MRASSTTFIPISGSTTLRNASRTASSRARRTGSKAGALSAVEAVVGWSVMLMGVHVRVTRR